MSIVGYLTATYNQVLRQQVPYTQFDQKFPLHIRCSLHITSRIHSNNFLLINLQKTKACPK